MPQMLSGTKVPVYSRAEWGARPAHVTITQGPPREAFLHHSDDKDAAQITRLAAQKEHMREIQNFHMNDRGWSDIGYHFVVFQPYGGIERARIFEGRSWSSVPAAQLGHNTGTFAVCVVGDFEQHDTLKRNTRYAIEALLAKHLGAHSVLTLGGHRDVVATSCPGRDLYRWIPRIADVTNLRLYKP